MKEAVAEVAQKVANRAAPGPAETPRQKRAKTRIGDPSARTMLRPSRIAARLSPRASNTAISAATAAKESWKLAPSKASGSNAKTKNAAQARLRIDKAGRSNNTATSITSVITSARSAPTREPVPRS